MNSGATGLNEGDFLYLVLEDTSNSAFELMIPSG